MTKKYNDIPVKDNMKVENQEEVQTESREKKPLKKVIQTQPTKVKRGLIGRLVNGVMGPEGLPSIGAYVNDEIIKPAVKNIIYDAITSGLSKALHMDHKGYRPTQGGGHGANRTPYNRNASTSRPAPHEERRTARPARYGVEEYVIEERYDAAHVLTTLTENADMYDSVSVADYYDLIGVASVYTDNTYGWTIDTILQATIIPVRGGYVIKFPPVEVIG
jgi:hypothetical protein